MRRVPVVHAVDLGEDGRDPRPQAAVGRWRGSVGHVERERSVLVAGEAERPIVGEKADLIDRTQPREAAGEALKQGRRVERAVIARLAVIDDQRAASGNGQPSSAAFDQGPRRSAAGAGDHRHAPAQGLALAIVAAELALLERDLGACRACMRQPPGCRDSRLEMDRRAVRRAAPGSAGLSAAPRESPVTAEGGANPSDRQDP